MMWRGGIQGCVAAIMSVIELCRRCAVLSLEGKDYISGFAIVASTIIAVVGWSRAAKKDRVQHLFQKRVERRLGMLDDVIAAVVPLMNSPAPFQADPDLPAKLAKARLSVQLYGYQDEQRLYEELVSAIEHGDVQRTRDALDSLVPTIRNRLRSEMDYPAEE
jgi:hypothetical protein